MHKKTEFLAVLANTKSLLKKSITEFNALKLDSDCYVYDLNGHHAHRVCSKPHIVVWVQFDTYAITIFSSKIFSLFLSFDIRVLEILKSNLSIQIPRYPYWPAKILKINHESKTVQVVFFQEYNMANVTCDNCYLFTNKDPNDYLTDQYKSEIQTAMEVSYRNFEI